MSSEGQNHPWVRIPEFHMSESYPMYSFVSSFFHSVQLGVGGFISVSCVSEWFIPFYCGTLVPPLRGGTITCLSVHLLMDIWVVFDVGHLWASPLEHPCIGLCECKSILLFRRKWNHGVDWKSISRWLMTLIIFSGVFWAWIYLLGGDIVDLIFYLFFKILSVVFIFLSFKHSLHILDTSPVSDVCTWNVFYWSLASFFNSLMVFWKSTIFFISMKFSLFISSFLIVLFLKTFVSTKIKKVFWYFFPISCPKFFCVILASIRLSSVIDVGLIFVCDVR